MSRTWLIVDAKYLCYRAYFALGELGYGGVRTEVIFGFLRDIITLQDTHNTSNFVFCFDRGKSLRCISYPSYKASRDTKERTEEDLQNWLALQEQVKLLRREYLPQLGFKNVLSAKGFEADDLIATVCQNLPKGDRGIIVSSDHDLFQLLTSRIIIWSPRTNSAITRESFTAEYGVGPEQWADVKAIAGCKTDDIEGVRGVGEKTAAKFLSGKLKTTSKAHEAIIAGNHIWRRNLPLVKLPLAGTPTFELEEDTINYTTWQQLSDKLGMRSIRSGKVEKKQTRKGFGVV